MINKILNLILLIAIGTGLSSCGEKITYAEIETEFGNMKIELYNSTPFHRDNFIKLANEGFYDDLLFHRVMNNFMIQGGDPSSRNATPEQRLGTGGPGYTIDAEIGAPHIKGALSAARTPDAGNPEKKSSGSQFFIVHGDKIDESQLSRMESSKNITYNETQRKLYAEVGGYPSLDMDYTVYGMVVEGLDIIDKIAAVPTEPRTNRPIEDVKMKVRILN